MNNLKNTTFLIPFYFDSEDRVKNAFCIIGYLNKYFDTNIFIYEEYDILPRLYTEIESLQIDGLTYQSFKKTSKLIHRTALLNKMLFDSSTEFVVNYDTDVVFNPQQLIDSIDYIKSNPKSFVFPYGGTFSRRKKEIREKFQKSNFDLEIVYNSRESQYTPPSIGGALVASRKNYIDCGGENENFIGWGLEDNERVLRFEKLGFPIHKIDGPLYHFDHCVGPNSSSILSPFQFQLNEEEYNKISRLTKKELEEYVKTWRYKL